MQYASTSGLNMNLSDRARAKLELLICSARSQAQAKVSFKGIVDYLSLEKSAKVCANGGNRTRVGRVMVAHPDDRYRSYQIELYST